LQQAGLANAWFALQEEQLPLAVTGSGKRCLQDSHFLCAPDPALRRREMRHRQTRQDTMMLLLHTVALSTRVADETQRAFVW
jgi:hypothetical protein